MGLRRVTISSRFSVGISEHGNHAAPGGRRAGVGHHVQRLVQVPLDTKESLDSDVFRLRLCSRSADVRAVSSLALATRLIHAQLRPTVSLRSGTGRLEFWRHRYRWYHRGHPDYDRISIRYETDIQASITERREGPFEETGAPDESHAYCFVSGLLSRCCSKQPVFSVHLRPAAHPFQFH